jgi:hypothetical protein
MNPTPSKKLPTVTFFSVLADKKGGSGLRIQNKISLNYVFSDPTLVGKPEGQLTQLHLPAAATRQPHS